MQTPDPPFFLPPSLLNKHRRKDLTREERQFVLDYGLRTCMPGCCNKLTGLSWLLLLRMLTNNTATIVNQRAVDALITQL